MIKEWITETLFDWIYVIAFRLLQGFLYILSFVEKFFDIFAGTAKVYYKGNTRFLIDIFFAHSTITKAFWAMALIAIVLAFGFAIFNLARKVSDISGRMKQTVGDIMGNFVRCLLIILMINAGTVAAINMANVLLDRINYALINAATLDQTEGQKVFTDQEFATMARVLATIGNYSVNPTSESRYNINSCFNALRPDLLSLYVNGVFDYDYPMDDKGHYTWQGALQMLAVSTDLTQDLPLDKYNTEVTHAIQAISKELMYYKDFAPQEKAKREPSKGMTTDVVIFLLCGMDAAENKQYRTGRFDDALRKDYINGKKSYNSLSTVRKDFDIWKFDYLLGYFSALVMIILLAICIFTFIVRMYNLLLLFITAPLFASSMPIDDGSKWQSWTQAFVIQLFSGFGLVVAMRLYLIIIPIVLSNDLVFFAGDSFGIRVMNNMAQLMMILGGAWAVLQSGNVITGILAGNPGMAAIQQEGQISGMVTRFAFGAPRTAVNAARTVGRTAFNVTKSVGTGIGRRFHSSKTSGKSGGEGSSGGGGGSGGSGGDGGSGGGKVPARAGRDQGMSDVKALQGGSGGAKVGSLRSDGTHVPPSYAPPPPPRARSTGGSGSPSAPSSSSAPSTWKSYYGPRPSPIIGTHRAGSTTSSVSSTGAPTDVSSSSSESVTSYASSSPAGVTTRSRSSSAPPRVSRTPPPVPKAPKPTMPPPPKK